jgi:acetyl esterase/lipase
MRKRMIVSLAAISALIVALGAARPPVGGTSAVPRVKLWEKAPMLAEGQDRDADPLEPTMDLYLPPKDSANGAAFIVLPGGGYTNLAMGHEGADVGKLLQKNNIAAFVVRYRHAPRYHTPVPLLDAQRALRTVRANAKEYNVDPHRIGILGFSAGGHLAASVATASSDSPLPDTVDAIDKESARPDFVVLGYPVINMTDDHIVHKGSRDALTQKDESLFAKLSPEQHVTKDTPPVFIVHGTDDKTVPVMNAVLFYEACLKNQVPAELHIFSNGRHGFGLGGTDPALRTWPDLMLKWMERNKWLTPAAK